MEDKNAKELIKWLKEERDVDAQIITKEGSINFKCDGCRDGMSKCCTNRNDISISPYDMYKLQKNLELNAKEIIEKYLDNILGSDSKIPMLVIKNNEYAGTETCKFLKRMTIDGKQMRGCSIHGFKPSMCELFPVGRFVKKDKKTNEDKLYYMVQNIECGLPGDNMIKIKDWVPDINNSERAFLEFSKFTTELYKTLNLKKFINSKKIIDESKNLFISCYYATMYTYDTDRDFFEQFEAKKEVMLDIAKKFNDLLKWK